MHAPRTSLQLVLLLLAAVAPMSARAANIAPTPTIISAAMRPGTTLMDVIYQVSDPDDATVRVRALAFVNGTRSFANILRPVTFVEGTAGNIGNSIPANTNQVLTWNVAADWNVDLGQVKFEILALDSRGLLGFDWITIPAAAGQSELTISKDTPSNSAVLNALFWLYADGDPGLSLSNGVLTGNAQSGVFNELILAEGTTLKAYAPPFVVKRMNLSVPSLGELSYANGTARAGLSSATSWHVANSAWSGVPVAVAWGNNASGQTTVPTGLSDVIAMAAGKDHSLALKSDGTVVAWGTGTAVTGMPAGLSRVTAIAAGYNHSLALKSDGTVVAWGDSTFSKTTVPTGLSGVTAIAAGYSHSLALKSDGTVIGWGSNTPYGQTTIPTGLSGVTAIASGYYHALALKSDGTVVTWGYTGYGLRTIPTGLSGVIAIAGGNWHSLALKSNGTVVAWGDNTSGQTTVPAGISGVTAISAGAQFSLALKSNGSVAAWGDNFFGQSTISPGLTGVTIIAAGDAHALALKAKAP